MTCVDDQVEARTKSSSETPRRLETLSQNGDATPGMHMTNFEICFRTEMLFEISCFPLHPGRPVTLAHSRPSLQSVRLDLPADPDLALQRPRYRPKSRNLLQILTSYGQSGWMGRALHVRRWSISVLFPPEPPGFVSHSKPWSCDRFRMFRSSKLGMTDV
jgi:hypothetical protein